MFLFIRHRRTPITCTKGDQKELSPKLKKKNLVVGSLTQAGYLFVFHYSLPLRGDKISVLIVGKEISIIVFDHSLVVSGYLSVTTKFTRNDNILRDRLKWGGRKFLDISLEISDYKEDKCDRLFVFPLTIGLEGPSIFSFSAQDLLSRCTQGRAEPLEQFVVRRRREEMSCRTQESLLGSGVNETLCSVTLISSFCFCRSKRYYPGTFPKRSFLELVRQGR